MRFIKWEISFNAEKGGGNNKMAEKTKRVIYMKQVDCYKSVSI